MMFLSEPRDFNPRFDIVSCFLEYEGKFLILHRCDNKSEGNTWGAPAGKMEKSEDLIDATARELSEETGVLIPREKFKYWGKTFVRYPEYDFVYHMCSAVCPPNVIVKINPKEHKDFRWVTPEEALKMNLIMDEDTSIKIFYKLSEYL
ncbi:MAG: NUDIX hydrolase [Candidatus Micrarchaeaceae archaeon]|jgi:8-oxo-dGTP pyrophosphatase MutT (NUDIX family)